MNRRSILSALILTGTLAASSASAQPDSDSMLISSGDQSTASEMTQAEAQRGDVADRPISPADSIEGAVLEGTVAAVDYETGQLVLDTDDGLIGFTGDPWDLADVHVGDVIRVALVAGDSN